MADIVILPGSLRKDSYNRKLAQIWAIAFKQKNIGAYIATSEELNAPLINEDENFPEALTQLSAKVAKAKGVLIVTPEYNGSISPVIKNFIDWTSTLDPHPWKGLPVLLSGTSPGAMGAISGLTHTRTPLDRLTAHVYPQSFGVPHGDKEVGGTTLSDEKKQKNLEKLRDDFLAFCQKLAK